MTDRYEVAVIGYGPVAQAAANLLGARGFRVAVFEIATSIYNLPRAAHFDGEVMRIWQSVGLAEATMSASAPIAGLRFVNGQGDVLFAIDVPERATASGWFAGYLFYQPDLEQVLQDGVAGYDNVDVFQGHEVTAISQDAGGVEMTVRDLSSGREGSVTADYLWGCDGARSLSRRAAGIELEDMGFDQPWLVIDTLLKREVELPQYATQICDPARPTTFIPSSGAHRRWEFMLMPEDDPETIAEPESVWRLLGGWISPDDAEVIRATVYSFHALIARAYRQGRIFIAGDAAHQMPPFLGQGMCAGVRDVANLTWKLDFVRQGAARDFILDTYFEERAPQVRRIIQNAVATGRVIQTTDPTVAAARDRMFAEQTASLDPQSRQLGSVDLSMPGLTGGLLARTGVGSAAGDMFPQTLVERDGRPARLDEVLGDGFAIIAGPDDSRIISEEAQEAWAFLSPQYVQVQPPTASGHPVERAITVRDREGLVLDWLRRNGTASVRPDRYVYGAAKKTTKFIALAESLRSALGARAAVS
ncbi:MAG TPA: bifunctional 3-(3-hydroxy-phenyl)propionate/3-hydroxycinnamic acid hydroxylase [Dehalococcoidia bacterium]|nr:bifunctional 3-(3-hydroxy-phenyl)propionate/3-hydroxycinnamic acid hydroxylase [Dehalococcoidia bacterium]